MGKKCLKLIVFGIMVILCMSAVSGLEKPIEGYVFDGPAPLKDATIKVFMKFEENSCIASLNHFNKLLCYLHSIERSTFPKIVCYYP